MITITKLFRNKKDLTETIITEYNACNVHHATQIILQHAVGNLRGTSDGLEIELHEGRDRYGKTVLIVDAQDEELIDIRYNVRTA